MDKLLEEQVEAARLAGITEGKLFDCTFHLYAKRVNIEGRARCEGHIIPDGSTVEAMCSTCNCYYNEKNPKS